MDRFKKVDLEAHFYTKEYVKALIQNNRYPKIVMEEKTDSYYTWFFKDTCTLFSTTFLEKLLDVNLRLKEMEKFGIEIQILSLATPGIEPLEPNVGVTLARKTNEYLAEIIQKHPEKLNGFATLPTQNPTRALEELEYAVKDLGLVGWATHSNYGKYGYIDDEKYRPILEEAEKLNIPIYIHPTVPAIKQLRAYGFALAGPPFGFTVETAMCAVRLILSGVFDKYPRLKIILGHLGEALPFLLGRIDKLREDSVNPIKLRKKPSDYVKENFFVTTSGNLYKPAFMCAYKALGINKILFATDYPYGNIDECIRFHDALRLKSEEKHKMYYENAVNLLNRLRFLIA